MDITQFMQLVDSGEHFADVEASVFLLEYARIVEKGAKVASGHVFHGKIDILRVLESVKQPDKPRCLGRGKDIAFNKDMSNLGSDKLRVWNKIELSPRPF